MVNPKGVQYYPMIRYFANNTVVPWELIAAQAQQESDFDEKCLSPTGAIGLMQIEPSTEPALSSYRLYEPTISISIGVAIMVGLYDVWREESGDDRWKFALASYNGGAGYVLAAQQACHAAGGKTDSWAEVSRYIGAPWKGKTPDANQIVNYVEAVWAGYQERLKV